MQNFFHKGIAATLALLLIFSFCSCGAAAPAATNPNTEQSAPSQEDTHSIPSLPTEPSHFFREIVISEIMADNKATLIDSDRDFSDWIELSNNGNASVNLGGWYLSNDSSIAGWQFPSVSLGPGEQLLVYVDGKDRVEGELHTNFKLSKKDTLTLRDQDQLPVATAENFGGKADYSYILKDNSKYQKCDTPTPGYPNTALGWVAFQEKQTIQSPLIISEVMSANYSISYPVGTEYHDWVELTNVSTDSIDLSGYYLSDEHSNPMKYRLSGILQPGAYIVILCDDSVSGSGCLCSGFGLDSESEQLFLADSTGTIVDYFAVRGLSYNTSCGRINGNNGLFYFSSPTPSAVNSNGARYISEMPTSEVPDGVYDNVEVLTVSLSGNGTIYYTTDGTLPTIASHEYTDPLQLTTTTIVRAIQVEKDSLPSKALTLTYLLNENLTLPAASLVTDNVSQFNTMYYGAMKGMELVGNFSYYDENGSFSAGCGVKMHGATSLNLNKKNMSLRFRAAYGNSNVDYDIFGGGITEFTNLLLRAGQDYYNCIIRDELGTALAQDFTENIVTQRFRYCVLFVNGEYFGIYALKEKANEQLYASLQDVSKSSVETLDANVSVNTDWYHEVFEYCETHDMSLTENYAHFCEIFDINSLIDWIVVEGYIGNSDLFSGNTRYVRSTEGDGKWRLMLFDLDSTFTNTNEIFNNLLGNEARVGKQSGILISHLMNNTEFRDLLLTRAAEAINGPFSNQAILEKIELLCEKICQEVDRDVSRFGRTYYDWKNSVDYLKQTISSDLWRESALQNLSTLFHLSSEEWTYYFGNIS